jgi:HEPN domain-containing protein
MRTLRMAKNTEYIIWQNRAFRFYLAARLLADKEIYGPATFCGYQAIELLIKATLIYWDKSFKPEDASHKLRKMLNTIGNKVKNGKNLNVPEYFYFEQRYQSVSRYPSSAKKGIGITRIIIYDLDTVFTDLVALVPFQFNSELIHTISGRDRKRLLILRKGNKQLRRLRKYMSRFIKGAA